MTEKRYKKIIPCIHTEKFTVFDKEESLKGNLEKITLTEDEIVDRLNEQEQKISCLQREYDKYKILYAQATKDSLEILHEKIELKNKKEDMDETIMELLRDKHQLNEYYQELKKENNKLKELLRLIADIENLTKEDSVKELIRRNIWSIDTVAGESADAYHDYRLLADFFKEHYGELWDNYDD